MNFKKDFIPKILVKERLVNRVQEPIQTEVEAVGVSMSATKLQVKLPIQKFTPCPSAKSYTYDREFIRGSNQSSHLIRTFTYEYR
ncbi:hypothetical protein L8106_06814 [Lyngbya sp. PCC 8106]|nr:hypothetical protein L8106_06814 [Lyngbya sp. PCC 8106]